MVRHTEPDRDFDDMDTDDLAAYINRVAPVAANLPEGEYAEPVLTANAEAAIVEFRDRHGITVDEDDDHLTGGDREPSEAEVEWGEDVDGFESAVGDAMKQAVTDGGEDPVEAAIDDEVGEDTDHYLRHTTTDEYDVAIRHDGVIRTDAEDGVVVHKVVESYDDEADGESLSWSVFPKCPIHGRVDKERTRDEDDGVVRIRWSCDGGEDDDGCPYEAVQAQVAGTSGNDVDDGLPSYGDPDYERPLWFRATVPHNFADDDFDPDTFDDLVEAADHDDENDAAGVANMIRKLSEIRNREAINDAAYVSGEFEDDEDGTPQKVEDAYLDTFECARCGAEHDVGADYTHPAHDDPVCRACEDDPEWSVDDADLPDDVEDAIDAYASVTTSKIVAYLRDVRYWRRYKAAAIEHADDPSGMFTVDTTPDEVDVDDVPACPTGEQGERRIQGHGSPGTGFRRPDGAAHGDSNWRVVLREVADAGLIKRVDDEDEDFDHPSARWETTDKGDRVFDELSRCEWCGARKTGHLWKHTYKVSRYNTATDYDLITRCPDGCRDDRNGKTVDLSEY